MSKKNKDKQKKYIVWKISEYSRTVELIDI